LAGAHGPADATAAPAPRRGAGPQDCRRGERVRRARTHRCPRPRLAQFGHVKRVTGDDHHYNRREQFHRIDPEFGPDRVDLDHDDLGAVSGDLVAVARRGDNERWKLMDNSLLWYVARASGIVAWSLVSASVLWGLALSTRAFGRRMKHSWLLDLHRFLGGLALVFTAVHILAIVSDSYVHFGLVEVLVPLAATWHPLAVSFGIVGFYLLLAVELTSLARDRLPRRLWRQVHFASFPLFAVTTVHLLAAGTDAQNPVLTGAVIGVVASVGALTTYRFLPEDPAPAQRTISVASAHSTAMPPSTAMPTVRATGARVNSPSLGLSGGRTSASRLPTSNAAPNASTR
jgi:hypothetical protein